MIITLILPFLLLLANIDASKKPHVVIRYPKQHYQVTDYSKNYYYKYYKYPYYKYKNYKWPKIRGRCKVINNFQFNGTNPVLNATRQGNVVILFLMKRTCKFCISQLQHLNTLGEHYRETGTKAKIIAINHKRQPLPTSIYRAYPFVDIYEEPNNKNIFGMVRGHYREILVYDVCGRQQYHYGWPYSWLGYPIVSALSFLYVPCYPCYGSSCFSNSMVMQHNPMTCYSKHVASSRAVMWEM